MIRPWLWLPPQVSHALSAFGVEAAAHLTPNWDPRWKPLYWKGLEFPNPLGTAGGLDKNAAHIKAWQKLGAGFIEVGTVTPRPQRGNSGSVIDRSLRHQALWNRMGFPSKGADHFLKNLAETPALRVPLFINIGKNRETSLEKAGEDYLFLAQQMAPHADALVINISSPNTPGLRSLAHVDSLKLWLESALKAAGTTPVLLKLSPDMSDEEFASTVRLAVALGVSGFILTNTTLDRPGNLPFPPEGGVSGRPLRERSLHALELIQKVLGSQRSSLLIISCGGVMTAEDVFDRLSRGADLVQVYSALVLTGPGFLKDVARKWKKRNPGNQD
jgi:dihydroorotate dehydrogenase